MQCALCFISFSVAFLIVNRSSFVISQIEEKKSLHNFSSIFYVVDIVLDLRLEVLFLVKFECVFYMSVKLVKLTWSS